MMGATLVGSIPECICDMENLSVLNLRGNHLEGQIPKCLFEMNLTTLDLSCNWLSGDYDITENVLQRIKNFDLSCNSMNEDKFEELKCTTLKKCDNGN